MRAAKKVTVDQKILQELVPLNALSPARFKKLSEKIVIEEVLAGCNLFRKGDRDNQSIYLLEGKINLIDGFRKVAGEVEAGTDISRYPIANQQPRSLSARAVKKVIIAKVDSSLLDVFLTWDQSSTADAVEIGAESSQDWMTRLLQSEAFIKIPPAMLQSLLIKMETLPVKAGDVVIRQGDSGDYFYTLHEGRCAVTCKDSPDGEERFLAELGDGDSFGEDALVSDAKRNATVSMLTDGLLMRLAKEDFVELLKNQLVKRVGYKQAAAMVNDGAVWMDVRTPDEYEYGAFEDSVNIPLSCLRDELSELVFNTKYIICCDTGRRSESAGFLLSHKGFDVSVLEGGIAGRLDNAVEPVVQGAAADSPGDSAEVIDFDKGRHVSDGQSGADGNDVATARRAGETDTALDELRAENESLTAQLQSQRIAEERISEQLDKLLADKQAAEEAVQGQQSEWDTERTALQQQLTESAEQNRHLVDAVESLQQAESLTSTADEQLQQLQAQLEEALEKTVSIEQLSGAKDAQLESLHTQLKQQEERVKELGQESDESVRKMHEDLTRKNDNEKELQGQIDRLRKKLGQQTIDHKQARDSAQDDTDNIREQLHVERQERAEERADMAARQRELKEQFAVIATEHETNLTKQSGAIEQARDAARQEEQERLREIIAAQVETEDQIIRLQQELKKAHEEIAEFDRVAKDRRQVDIELLEEQNQQAVATVSQLESQLQQLTKDRDVALEDQQLLRDKMKTLRSEAEDPAQLRKELDESKKDVEIALRLRAEAEAARDQLLQERDALQQDLSEVSTEPLHVPSLDEDPVGAGHPGPQQHIQQAVLPVTPLEQVNEPQSLVDGERDEKQRSWLGTVVWLGVVVVCALAGGLYIGVDIPVIGNDTRQQLPATIAPDDDPVPAAHGELPIVAVQQRMPQAEPASKAESVEVSPPDPEPVVVQVPLPEEPEVWPPAEDAAPVAEQSPVIAGRSFNDGLKVGGQGPVMVELPADSFAMGSTGNSLNFDEGPQHPVNVPAFSISKYEVTFTEYDRYARATGRRRPYDESWGRGDHPVINVSWGDARAYTRWLSRQTGKNYRLPSEAEWEYAARAGSAASFWWQNDSDKLHANCFDCGSEWDSMRTATVGSFEANDFGLHDVAGNVQEWTADCYHGSYHDAPLDGSVWVFPECTMRVVRGGAYTSPLDSLRSAKRSQYDQDTRLDNLGFRVVRVN